MGMYDSEERTITCQDCRQPYATKRRNTKFCNVCRISRDLLYMDERELTCHDCEQKYSPWYSGQKLCGKCDFVRPPKHEGECALCHTQGKLLHPNISVCPSCATSTEKRPVFRRAIMAKRRSRSEAA